MDDGIELNGLDDFLKNLTSVSDDYAETAEKHLRKAGNKLKKAAKEATPEKTGKLKKSWISAVKGEKGSDIEYQLRNKDPVYHLIERGHVQKTPSGRVTGYVQGKYFFEQAEKAFEDSGATETEFEKFFDDVKKKLEK